MKLGWEEYFHFEGQKLSYLIYSGELAVYVRDEVCKFNIAFHCIIRYDEVSSM